MAVGFYNHFTHNHLPSSTLYNGPQYKQHYPTSVFFNQNDFATFLCISFFLYATAVKNMKNGYVKAVSLLFAISALYLIILTGSRASLLGICAGAAVYVFILFAFPVEKTRAVQRGSGCCAVCGFICGPYHQCRLESVFSSAGDTGTATASFQPREGESFKERLSLCD